MQNLLARLEARLVRQARGPSLLPPWPPRAVAAWPGAVALLASRFGRGCRLVAAAAAWDGVLSGEEAGRRSVSSTSSLQAAVWEGLIARQLLPYARSALLGGGAPSPLRAAAIAAERVGRVVAALPRAWLVADATTPLVALLSEVEAAFTAAWAAGSELDRSDSRHGGGVLAGALDAVGETKKAGRVRGGL